MKWRALSKSDAKKIQRPLIGLALSIVLLVGVIAVLQHLDAITTQELMAARAQRQSAQAQLEKAQEEERQIRASWQRYQTLEQIGVFKPFLRAPIADKIEIAVKAIRNISFTYRLTNKQDYVGPEKPAAEDISIARYELEIQSNLPHEESFLGLAEGFTKELQGTLVWEQCTLTQRRFQSTELNAGLGLACKASFYNLKVPPINSPDAAPAPISGGQ